MNPRRRLGRPRPSLRHEATVSLLVPVIKVRVAQIAAGLAPSDLTDCRTTGARWRCLGSYPAELKSEAGFRFDEGSRTERVHDDPSAPALSWARFGACVGVAASPRR